MSRSAKAATISGLARRSRRTRDQAADHAPQTGWLRQNARIENVDLRTRAASSASFSPSSSAATRSIATQTCSSSQHSLSV